MHPVLYLILSICLATSSLHTPVTIQLCFAYCESIYAVIAGLSVPSADTCMICCRCFFTPDYLKFCPDRYGKVGTALLKVTDLPKWVFLGLPPNQPQSYATLAWHLNQEAALLTKACQESHVAAVASPRLHLDQDVLYTMLRCKPVSPALDALNMLARKAAAC